MCWFNVETSVCCWLQVCVWRSVFSIVWSPASTAASTSTCVQNTCWTVNTRTSRSVIVRCSAIVVSDECFLQRAGGSRSGVQTCMSSDSASTRPRRRARERGGSRTCTSSTWSSCGRFLKWLRTSSAPSSTCTRETLRRTPAPKSYCCRSSTRPSERLRNICDPGTQNQSKKLG